MTKIDVISGFLGAGKTTLIKKLLAEALTGEQVVLIENEFGEIGIDGGFLKEAGVQITEMNSGCICCSLVGDFRTALNQILDEYHPDRIIIEPTGVGKLSDVIKAVQQVAEDRDDAQMNAYATVADANKCRMYHSNFGEFYNDQIAAAGTVLLSRTADISDEKLQSAVSIIREVNAECAVVTTDWDALSGTKILEVMEKNKSSKLEIEIDEDEHEHHHHHHDHDEHDHEEHEHHHHDHDDEEHEHHHHDHDDEEHEHHHHHHDGEECDDPECECHHHHHHHHDGECDDPECSCHHHGHHHADDVFTSWGIETAAKYSRSELDEILESLSEDTTYGMILRAKGIVPSSDEDGIWYYFDLVPGEYEIRTGEADYTGRLCVIGSKLKEEEIRALFDRSGKR